MIGRSLSHYRILAALGAGGMGQVYRARDERLNREVALKVLASGLLSNDHARNRFRNEARVLSRLTHPHVAMLLDSDRADGFDFLVMELVPGPTIAQELRRGALPPKEVARLGAQLARGLHAAHGQGVIHGDLKPSNLGLTEDGLLKILDFGVARLIEPEPDTTEDTATQTGAGKAVGSPPYMAPEQMLGKKVDERTDIYSAGAVLYELATGRRLFHEAKGPALIASILNETPFPPREISPDLPPATGVRDPEGDREGPGVALQDGQGPDDRPGAGGRTASRPSPGAARLPVRGGTKPRGTVPVGASSRTWGWALPSSRRGLP